MPAATPGSPPAVTIDLRRLDANLHRFQLAAQQRGIRVRAHLKAHRTIELARRQVAAGAVGVAVQTAHAAVRLAAAGVPDVVLAWPWPPDPWRLAGYAEAAGQVPRFAVHVDQPAAVTGIGAAATRQGTTVGVRVDLRHTPEAAVLELARLAADTPGVRFDGITGYAAPETRSDIADRDRFGRRYAQQVVEQAEAIRAAGLDCPMVSVGGTPTAAGSRSVAGVTEICAGAYATFDGGLAQAGVCTADQVALTVAEHRTDLLAGCGQPWAPQVAWLPAAPHRLAPAHICPLAVTLVRQQVPITVLDGDHPVGSWQPFAAPDRAPDRVPDRR